jgi:hypothetical protein
VIEMEADSVIVVDNNIRVKKRISDRKEHKCMLGGRANRRDLPCIRQDIENPCPYWCPIVDDPENYKRLSPLMISEYLSCDGTNKYHILRDRICSFYRQFRLYQTSTAIVMTGSMWLTETVNKRKPMFDAEIINCKINFKSSITMHDLKELIEYNEEVKDVDQLLICINNLRNEYADCKDTLGKKWKYVLEYIGKFGEFFRETADLLRLGRGNVLVSVNRSEIKFELDEYTAFEELIKYCGELRLNIEHYANTRI